MNDFWGCVYLMAASAFLVWICSEPRIYPASVAYAENVCAQNGGFAFIEEGVTEFSSVTCKNGAEFNYNWQELREDSK